MIPAFLWSIFTEMSSVRDGVRSLRSAADGFFGEDGDQDRPSGVVPGSYGSASESLQISVASPGTLLSVTALPIAFVTGNAVSWGFVANPYAAVALVPMVFTSVRYDSGTIIDEVVAGDTMTVSATGLYYVTLAFFTTPASGFNLNVNGSIAFSTFNSSSTDKIISNILPLSAGDLLTVVCSANTSVNTTSGRSFSLFRLS